VRAASRGRMSQLYAGAEAGGDGAGAGTFADAERELDGLGKEAAFKVSVDRRKSVGCGGCCALVLGLVVYLASAANAANEIANGAAAEMKIFLVENLCDQKLKLTGEVRILNPSSWSASISATGFHIRNTDGVLLNQAEGAGTGIQPEVIHMPPNSNEWQPLVMELETVDLQSYGELWAQTLADGSMDVLMDLDYSGGLDNFPLKASGTMKVLLTTDMPGNNGAASREAEQNGDMIVRMGKIEFSAEVLSIDAPVVTDTAEVLSVATRAVVSATWPPCLLLHMFGLPQMDIRVSSAAVGGNDIATFRIVRYKLPDDYDAMSWENNDVEVWLKALVTADQADNSRDVSNLLASVEPEVPLHFRLDTDECLILQIFDIAFGQHSITSPGLLSNATRVAIANVLNGTTLRDTRTEQDSQMAAHTVDGALEEIHPGLYFDLLTQNATYEAAMDWFGFVPQDRAAYSAQPAGPDVYPEYGEDTSVDGEMQYRPGSLVAALVLAQPWTKLVVGVPTRRCAEAEQDCLNDPTCSRIVNSVVDPVAPTAAETLRCTLNSICALSLAQCAPRAGDPVPVGIATRFDVSPPRHVSEDADSVLITATYPQSQLTGLVQSLVDEISPALAGDQSQVTAFDMWQLSLLANADPPTVLGKALGFRLNVVTPSDLDQIIANSAIFQQEETDVEAEALEEEEEVVDEVEGTSAPSSGSACREPVPPPTLELLPRRPDDSDQTLRMQAVWTGPPDEETDPDKQLRVYPANKIALKLYFDDAGDHWDGWDVSAAPAHTDAQRMMTIEFEGSMLITQTWTFDITLFNGPSLEHFASQSIQYAWRDGGLALGFDVSLDDDAVVMPLDLVLWQLPRVCSGGLAGGPGGRDDGGPPRDGPPGDSAPPPTPNCVQANEGPDMRFVTDVHTAGSLMDGSGTTTMELSNPLGVGFAIKNINLRVDKVTHQWIPAPRGSHQHGHSVDRAHIITSAHLTECGGHTPCVSVLAHCVADQACGRVHFGVGATLLVDYSEVQDVDHAQLNINREWERSVQCLVLLDCSAAW
jgi:hypothetical protein